MRLDMIPPRSCSGVTPLTVFDARTDKSALNHACGSSASNIVYTPQQAVSMFRTSSASLPAAPQVRRRAVPRQLPHGMRLPFWKRRLPMLDCTMALRMLLRLPSTARSCFVNVSPNMTHAN